MSKKKYLQNIHRDRGLTPLQSTVLAGFAEGRPQDRVTIASYLDGQHGSVTRYASLRLVADDVLKQLNAIGVTRVDADGWHWLVDQPCTTQPASDDY